MCADLRPHLKWDGHVLHGESSKRLASPRNTRQNTPTINPIGPTDTPHRPSTKQYRKDSLGDAQHQLTQQPCTLQHNNNPPASPTPDRMAMCGLFKMATYCDTGKLPNNLQQLGKLPSCEQICPQSEAIASQAPPIAASSCTVPDVAISKVSQVAVDCCNNLNGCITPGISYLIETPLPSVPILVATCYTST